MSPRTGRPPKENPRNVSLNLRLTRGEADLIQECADSLNTTRTEVIVQGVKMVRKAWKINRVLAAIGVMVAGLDGAGSEYTGAFHAVWYYLSDAEQEFPKYLNICLSAI